MESIKRALFDVCKFFESNTDYFIKIENYEQANEQNLKYEGCMAVIESLGLVEEYRDYTEK